MRHPTGADVLEQARIASVGPVKVAAPAWVLAYDRVKQTATIQIAIAYQVQDPETGERVFRVRQPVSNVPVAWPGGTTWDLEAGETGLATFCDRSIDEWKATGNRAVKPADPRRFDITDATFTPGVTSPADPLPAGAYAAGAVVLWDRGTGDVRLGGSPAVERLVLGDTFLTALKNVETELLALSALGIPTTQLAAMVAFITTSLTAASAPYLSGTVKTL